METVAKAFFSYAHDDNRRENGRILQLATLIREEFESLTGATIEIFTDRAEILWGQDFRARLNEALQETTFFIPVLSPTYFLRDECRKEMRQFVSSAREVGLEKLLLSIRYLVVPDMHEESKDELKAIAASIQFEPWDQHRLRNVRGSIHRAAVHRLASRLVQLTQVQEQSSDPVPPPVDSGAALIVDIPDRQIDPFESEMGFSTSLSPRRPVPETIADTDDDSVNGLIDDAADATEAMSEWQDTISEISTTIRSFNVIVNEASLKMIETNEGPNAFATRISFARKLAKDLEPTLTEIEALSKKYSAGLLRVDPGMRAMLTLATTSTDLQTNQKFVQSVHNLIDTSVQAAENSSQAADSARQNAGLSRDLRPVLRRFETALRNIADGVSTIQEWRPLLDAVPLPITE